MNKITNNKITNKDIEVAREALQDGDEINRISQEIAGFIHAKIAKSAKRKLHCYKQDLIEKIEKKKLTKDKAYKDKREIECQCGSGEKHTLPLQDWTDVSIYNTALSDIIKIIQEK